MMNKKASVHTLPVAHDLPINSQPMPPLVLIRLPEVLRRTALSKTSIYDLMKSGEFAQSVPLGGKAVAWVEHEVNQWIADRIAISRSGAN